MSSNVWNDEQPFPKDIVHRFEDALDFLSPDFKAASDLVSATYAVNNIKNDMYSKAANDDPVSVYIFLRTRRNACNL